MPSDAKITNDQYVQDAIRTESPITEGLLSRLRCSARLLHAAMGICTEAGELQDALKKHIFYGKPLDTINMLEEIGNLMWYVALFCSATGVSLDSILRQNIIKLRARYPEKFTEEAALIRDLDAERKVLEDTTPCQS